MASRFLENITEAPVQTREEIQEESEAKVGETEVDEGSEDCAVEFGSMWVCRCLGLMVMLILGQLLRFMACCSWIGIKSRKARNTNPFTLYGPLHLFHDESG